MLVICPSNIGSRTARLQLSTVNRRRSRSEVDDRSEDMQNVRHSPSPQYALAASTMPWRCKCRHPRLHGTIDAVHCGKSIWVGAGSGKTERRWRRCPANCTVPALADGGSVPVPLKALTSQTGKACARSKLRCLHNWMCARSGAAASASDVGYVPHLGIECPVLPASFTD